MVKVYFNESEVQNTITNLTEAYQLLEEKLIEMKQEKAKLSEFWTAAEADRFNQNLETVVTAFDNFKTKYDGYLTFLNSVATAYSADDKSFVSTINSIAASVDGGASN